MFHAPSGCAVPEHENGRLHWGSSASPYFGGNRLPWAGDDARRCPGRTGHRFYVIWALNWQYCTGYGRGVRLVSGSTHGVTQLRVKTSLGPPQTFSTAETKHVPHVTYHPHVSGGAVPRITPHPPHRSPFSDPSSAWDMEGLGSEKRPKRK